MQTENYQAQNATDHGVDVVRLTDAATGVEVWIAPSIGNRAYSMTVHGKDILYLGAQHVGELKANPVFSGIPFLAPWANRISETGFWANGKRYVFNHELGTLRTPKNGLVSHGMLTATPRWEVTELKTDGRSAWVTSRLEFWKYPDLMANWPIAHEYEMTYKLADGALEVITTVVNRSSEAMPLSVGYHPYFNLPDVPRDDAAAHIPAKSEVIVDDRMLATGEIRPADLPDRIQLRDRTLDQGFTDLIRDKNGLATFYIEGDGKKIEVAFGPKWIVGIVWEPAGKNFICFEPMAGITNAVNLAHEGKYPQLQVLAPGATWRESFWVSANGW